jgi:hypothetical protein
MLRQNHFAELNRHILTFLLLVGCFLSTRGAVALMAQPNHHLQTVYPSDYKTQTKLSG